MRLNRTFIISLVAILMLVPLLFIVSGEHGLMDLFTLRTELSETLARNEKIFDENVSLYRRIERLKNDPEFIEATARKELGVIGTDEMIFKLK